MTDIFTESIVRRKPIPGGSTLQTVLVALTIGSAILGIGINFLLLVFAAVFGVLWYLVRQNADVEFEYAHTNGDLDIDKVIANSSRKRVASVDLSRVDLVAPVDSPELSRFQNLKREDYSAKDPQDPPYGMVCTMKDGKKLLLLQLDEKMLSSLKKWMPSKVIK